RVRPGKSHRWRRRAAVAAGVVCAFGAGLLAGWRMKPGVAHSDPIPTSRVRLSFDSGLSGFPSISADGKLVAYASDRAGNGSLDIWLQHVGGGEPVPLTSSSADEYDPVF